MRYYLEEKNGNSSGWELVRSFSSERKAVESCIQRMKQKRGSQGFQWLKTRVAIDSDSGRVRVFPPMRSISK